MGRGRAPCPSGRGGHGVRGRCRLGRGARRDERAGHRAPDRPCRADPLGRALRQRREAVVVLRGAGPRRLRRGRRRARRHGRRARGRPARAPAGHRHRRRGRGADRPGRGHRRPEGGRGSWTVVRPGPHRRRRAPAPRCRHGHAALAAPDGRALRAALGDPRGARDAARWSGRHRAGGRGLRRPRGARHPPRRGRPAPPRPRGGCAGGDAVRAAVPSGPASAPTSTACCPRSTAGRASRPSTGTPDRSCRDRPHRRGRAPRRGARRFRESVVADGGVEALLAWSRTPDGAADPQVLRALLGALPPRSPRRAGLVAAVESLEGP